MKRYGDSNVIQSEIKSDGFASTQEFNKLVVNNLSEVDQESLDHNVIIFNKDDDQIYTYDRAFGSWKSTSERRFNTTTREYDLKVVYIDDVTDVYNQIMFDTYKNSHLSVDNNAIDFGVTGSPVDFVIDFWVNPDEYCTHGTLLYNGVNSGGIDIEQSRNLLITSHGAELVKDSMYAVDPVIIQHPENDGYVNIFRPPLRSIEPLSLGLNHIALIRSGDTTYLAVNGKINDSAPSVEYFFYDDLLIGSGYYQTSDIGIINLRVSRGTDRGWTEDFTPPNFNHTVDGNTRFLMDSTSFVDTTGNYDITVIGDDPDIVTGQFPYHLDGDHIDAMIRTNLSELNLQVPYGLDAYSYYFHPEDNCTITINLGHSNTGMLGETVHQLTFSDNNVYELICEGQDVMFRTVDVKLSPPAMITEAMRNLEFATEIHSVLRCGKSSVYDILDSTTLVRKSPYVTRQPDLLPFPDVNSVIDCRVGDTPIWDGDANENFNLSGRRGAWVDFLFQLTDNVAADSNILYSPDPTTDLSIENNYLSILNGSKTTSTFQLIPGVWYHVILDYYFGYTSGHYQICQGTIEIAPLFSTVYHRDTLQGGRRNEDVAYCFKSLTQGPWLISSLRYKRTAYNSGTINNTNVYVGDSWTLTDFMKTGSKTELDHLRSTLINF